MNWWLYFWMVMLVVAGVSFAGITVIVAVKGFRDLRQWFASLRRQNAERIGTNAGVRRP